MTTTRFLIITFIVSSMLTGVSGFESRQPAQQALFTSNTARVTVAVVARDRNGRPMAGLSAEDFTITDDGEPRTILDFRNDRSPISVGLLLDTSGSMHVGPKFHRASEVGHFLLAAMNDGEDEAALFVFDKSVHTAQPFTGEFDAIRSALASVHTFGSTSLYDAIAQTAQELARRPGRRALVVVTDGVDTSSALTAAAVSGIASTIDMPVYVVAVGAPIDRTVGQTTDTGDLTDLARWSGGMFYRAENTAEGSVAAREIVADLRDQYLLAFEPHSGLGWHRIDVHARQRATLQARSGYWVGPAPVR